MFQYDKQRTILLSSTQQPAYLYNLISYHQFQSFTSCLYSQSLLHVPRMVKTDFGRRAFSSAAPQIRNHTPTAIRASASLDSFRHHLKTHYLPRHNSHHAPIATPRSSDLIFNFRVLPNFYVTLQQNSVSNASDLPRPRLRHFTVR